MNEGYEDEVIESEEDDEDDDVEYEDLEMVTWKAYYKHGKAKTTREKLLLLFCDHFQNILGGCKKERQAILHTQHVRAVQDHLDKNHEDETVESLVKNGGMDVWKTWAKPVLDDKRMRPGSVKSYFNSLAKYMAFIIDQVDLGVEDFPDIPDALMKSVRAVKGRFLKMASAITSIYAHEKWQKQLDEEANAIPASVPGSMMQTEAANEALKLLTVSYTRPPNEKEFVAIRDYLIARLELENCQRPGPLESAKLSDFERAKEVDGRYVMKIARHKTEKAGPAPITMTSNTRTNVQAYIKCVRPHFARADVQELFVTKTGVAFPTGTIGKRVIAWWRRATGLHLSSTDLRKIGSSEMIDEDPATQAAVQVVMTHNRGTAEHHYAILKKTRQAVKGSATIARKLGLADSKPTVLPSPEKSSSGPPSVAPSPSKSGLTKDQLEDIDILFSEQITTNAQITFGEVKNGMSESIHMVEGVNDADMVGKVYRRVKYLQRKLLEENLARVPTADAEEVTSLWTTTSSGGVSGLSKRIQWSEKDLNIIKNAFADYDQCPKKGEIAHTFQSDTTLREVMTRNTFNRCYEKVKTIFRQLRK